MSVRHYLTVLALFAMLLAMGCSSSAPGEAEGAARRVTSVKIPVQLAEVQRADLAASIELVGSLLPRRRTVIVSEVDGVIKDLADMEDKPLREHLGSLGSAQLVDDLPSLDLGTRVKKGQEIVWLDSSEYDLRLAAATTSLDYVRRELEKLFAWRRPEEVRKAEAARDEAAARVALAGSEFDRLKPLLAKGAVSKVEYDRIAAEAKTAQAALDRADAELALSKAGPTEEEIAVAKAAIAQAEAEVAKAQWYVDKTIIRAPYDGVVTDRYVDEGERVTAMPRVEILEIMDLSFLLAQLGVPERRIGQIQIGDEVKVYMKGSVEPVPGVVALVNDKVDPANRTFRIRVMVRNDERQFKVGQFVRVALQIQSEPDALTIPGKAIAYTGGEAHVFVFADGLVHKRPVELGVEDADTVEVLSGLEEGEQVVVDDPSILSDGMAVEVKSSGSGQSQE
jgi:HlyD family secretion protein